MSIFKHGHCCSLLFNEVFGKYPKDTPGVPAPASSSLSDCSRKKTKKKPNKKVTPVREKPPVNKHKKMTMVNSRRKTRHRRTVERGKKHQIAAVSTKRSLEFAST
jgi:hypothetical protein